MNCLEWGGGGGDEVAHPVYQLVTHVTYDRQLNLLHRIDWGARRDLHLEYAVVVIVVTGMSEVGALRVNASSRFIGESRQDTCT
jgi:hypothetical protein